MINIAVLGYGTIGAGVVEVLEVNKKIIAHHAGYEINVKYVLDLRDFPNDRIQEKIVHDYNIILQDPQIKIVVEAMGGINPAYEFARKALESGKSVVTSNKELVAKHGAELLKLAKESSLNFLFEASVGGGIPIIRPLNRSLTADVITEISGILNGTTNFILTKMQMEGLPFDAVLKEAQERGYAERNPEADVEGHDAGRKIAILSSLAHGLQVDYDKIYTEGITKITDIDVKYAKYLDASIRLVATCKTVEAGTYARVSPMLLDSDHPLADVYDVYNAVHVKGNMVGSLKFQGQGAGKLPTASAVVGDIVDAAKHPHINIPMYWDEQKLELLDIDLVPVKFFVRVIGDINENREKIDNLYGNVKYVLIPSLVNEFAFITEEFTEKEHREKLSNIINVVSKIRTTL
ncbi:MAG: hom 1 [Clostridiales bacterium]|jgi:homoserine dehydrogenase|nr:hom 1 [Clostridiales bacterium]